MARNDGQNCPFPAVAGQGENILRMVGETSEFTHNRGAMASCFKALQFRLLAYCIAKPTIQKGFSPGVHRA